MTSREIAELTKKEISHVHRDIRTLLDDLKDDPEVDHVREDKDARGYTACFHLTKSLTMTLVAGYSAKLRHAIVKRWQELEEQARNPVASMSRLDLLTLALDSEVAGRLRPSAWLGQIVTGSAPAATGQRDAWQGGQQ